MHKKYKYIDFPIPPRKAWELNQRLKTDGLSWFYKDFMTQKNMLESRFYSTEVILLDPIELWIEPKKFNIEGEEFFLPVVYFHPQSNIVRVLGIQEDEIVLVSRFQYFPQIQKKVPKPQFWGCIRLIDNIAPHYGFVVCYDWDRIDYSNDDETSLVIHPLRGSNSCPQETVKTLIEREELGISVNRVLIKVNLSYFNETNEQEWQEVFVYLLDNSEPYDTRVYNIIRENLGGGWAVISWQAP